ncbi:MAG: hypothetical protein ACREA9_08765 [Pyrinomonadaceae bacterium]
MRIGVLILALAAIVTCYGCGRLNAGTRPASSASTSSAEKPAPGSPTNSPKVDFSTQFKPILEAKCRPCHFSGGKVYAKLPFDRPETIKTLGTKMFTRIKDQNEQRLIRAFLAQAP